MDYTLRDTAPSDSDFCYRVKKTVLYNYVNQIWGWDEQWQEEFHRKNFHPALMKIISVNGSDTGTVEIVESDRAFFISGLYILPAWQKIGLGTAIIKRYIKEAAEKNKPIELEVLKLNEDARRLYTRLGFVLMEKDNEKYFMYKDIDE